MRLIHVANEYCQALTAGPDAQTPPILVPDADLDDFDAPASTVTHSEHAVGLITI